MVKAICAIAAMTKLMLTTVTGAMLAYGVPVGGPTWLHLAGDACISMMVLVLIYAGE